jgi:N-carbamoylputrescine amidase
MSTTSASPTEYNIKTDKNPRIFKVAATQIACTGSIEHNIQNAIQMVRKAANEGAKVILLQELFENIYFCYEQNGKYFQTAHVVTEEDKETGIVKIVPDKFIRTFQNLAKELKVVLPISFFERCTKSYFNSLIMIDSDGSCLGIYRKTHIPDGFGYQEKYYFQPGDTGFRVWECHIDNFTVKIGVAICWDQWFPETARCLALKGAEILMFPTAIGSEPQDPKLNSRLHWQRVMQGHSAANLLPVIASNRVGKEKTVKFYGSCFITDETGAIVAEGDQNTETCVTYTLNIDKVRFDRACWGLFRDRRPSMYETIITTDGFFPDDVRRAKCDYKPNDYNGDYYIEDPNFKKKHNKTIKHKKKRIHH